MDHFISQTTEMVNEAKKLTEAWGLVIVSLCYCFGVGRWVDKGIKRLVLVAFLTGSTPSIGRASHGDNCFLNFLVGQLQALSIRIWKGSSHDGT